MVGTKELKARIKGVKNIRQITKAMQMVAVAKLKKFQSRALASRPYEYKLNEIVKEIKAATENIDIEHPLLDKRADNKNIHILLCTSDRGLCGGYNSNILKFTENFIKEHRDKTITFSVIGKKGKKFLKRNNLTCDYNYNHSKDVTEEFVNELINNLLDGYTKYKYDEIYVLFTRFGTPVKSDPMVNRILPIQLPEEEQMPGKENVTVKSDAILEPGPLELLSALLPQYLKMLIFKSILESITSEHGARMVAMKTATDNADDMLSSLTLTYNRMRQTAITTEILEVASGAEALKG